MIAETVRPASTFRHFCSESVDSFKAMSTKWKVLTVSSIIVLGVALPIFGGFLSFFALTRWHKKNVTNITKNENQDRTTTATKDVANLVIIDKKADPNVTETPHQPTVNPPTKPLPKTHQLNTPRASSTAISLDQEEETPKSSLYAPTKAASQPAHLLPREEHSFPYTQVEPSAPLAQTDEETISTVQEPLIAPSPLYPSLDDKITLSSPFGHKPDTRPVVFLPHKKGRDVSREVTLARDGGLMGTATVYSRIDGSPIDIELTQKVGIKVVGVKHVTRFEAFLAQSPKIIGSLQVQTVKTKYDKDGNIHLKIPSSEGYDGSSKKILITAISSLQTEQIRGVGTALMLAAIRKSQFRMHRHFRRMVVQASDGTAGFFYKFGFRCANDPIKEAKVIDIGTYGAEKYGPTWGDLLQSVVTSKNLTDAHIAEKVAAGQRVTIESALMYLPSQAYNEWKDKVRSKR